MRQSHLAPEGSEDVQGDWQGLAGEITTSEQAHEQKPDCFSNGHSCVTIADIPLYILPQSGLLEADVAPQRPDRFLSKCERVLSFAELENSSVSFIGWVPCGFPVGRA